MCLFGFRILFSLTYNEAAVIVALCRIDDVNANHHDHNHHATVGGAVDTASYPTQRNYDCFLTICQTEHDPRPEEAHRTTQKLHSKHLRQNMQTDQELRLELRQLLNHQKTTTSV